jgi:hypothetical protein
MTVFADTSALYAVMVANSAPRLGAGSAGLTSGPAQRMF